MSIYSKINSAWKAGGLFTLLERARWKLKIMFRRDSFLDIFMHKMSHGLPNAEFEVKDFKTSGADILIAKRIMESFERALAHQRTITKYGEQRGENVWNLIEKNQHDDFFQIMLSKNPSKIADYLNNLHRHGISRGISGFCPEEYDSMDSKLKRQLVALDKDRMVSFAEALGILQYQSAGENIYIDSDLLIDEIQKTLGIDIASPDIEGGLIKIKMGKNHFSCRDIYCLYAAWRINQLVRPNTSDSICEIGAGLGKVALYARRFGFFDYSIFDLPQINVVQAWNMLKGGLEVTLYGETEKTKKSIKIMPYWEFDDKRTYTITLNMDSFPEIDKEIVTDYLRKINKNTTDYFLSINQEHLSKLRGPNNSTVSNVVKKVGGFKSLHRFPWWLKKDYVEELYSIIK